MMVKEESEKAGLILSIQTEGEKDGSSDRFHFLGLQNHWTVMAAMKLKDTCSLEGKL